ncbi:hypothetical protein [Ramlibacter sp. Leaf400]|uniref:hypothetical protein n=1 Tax=Ramlibacter sp. Leaf400 TaxID=1736365 RepID=UPI0006FEC5F1|nr:hypothetical protein [Ramlibacter sp. Leaf400]KQT08744.1 hypothetical protein ASG30_14750 [Ramlibacter sp. Leaf400]
MARLLQHLLASFDHDAQDARDRTANSLMDDDLALGCECANPALQFESWEPAAAVPMGPAPSY